MTSVISVERASRYVSGRFADSGVKKIVGGSAGGPAPVEDRVVSQGTVRYSDCP